MSETVLAEHTPTVWHDRIRDEESGELIVELEHTVCEQCSRALEAGSVPWPCPPVVAAFEVVLEPDSGAN